MTKIVNRVTVYLDYVNSEKRRASDDILISVRFLCYVIVPSVVFNLFTSSLLSACSLFIPVSVDSFNLPL